MTRMQLPPSISDQRVIAVIRRLTPERIISVSELLVSEGIDVIEITMDTDGALDAIARLAADGRSVGAGTVRTIVEAETAVAAGASFVVSPHTDPGIVAWTVANAVPVMAGAVTPTEISHAWSLGVSAVKLFPASLGGPSFLKNLAGPFSDITFVPTGGVDGGNAGQYLDSGAVAVGVGGWLTGQRDFGVMRDRAAELLDVTRRR